MSDGEVTLGEDLVRDMDGNVVARVGGAHAGAQDGAEWMPVDEELQKLREERDGLIARHNEAATLIANLRTAVGEQTGRVVALEQQIVAMQDQAARSAVEAKMQSVRDVTSLRIRLTGALSAVQALCIALRDCDDDGD